MSSKMEELPDLIYITFSRQEANNKSPDFIQNTWEIKHSPFWCHLRSRLSFIVEQSEDSGALSVV